MNIGTTLAQDILQGKGAVTDPAIAAFRNDLRQLRIGRYRGVSICNGIFRIDGKPRHERWR